MITHSEKIVKFANQLLAIAAFHMHYGGDKTFQLIFIGNFNSTLRKKNYDKHLICMNVGVQFGKDKS